MNIVFIKYEKFMKIILQKRMIVIKIIKLKTIQKLFQFYILSLLTSNNITTIYSIYNFKKNNIIFGISTQKIWKYLSLSKGYDIIPIEKNSTRNPLLSQEPKRETGMKKMKKFMKMLYYYYDKNYINDPVIIIDNYISRMISLTNVEKIIKYEKQIYLLSCIKSFNNDIYNNIKKFL
jgi:hypothetical protein